MDLRPLFLIRLTLIIVIQFLDAELVERDKPTQFA